MPEAFSFPPPPPPPPSRANVISSNRPSRPDRGGRVNHRGSRPTGFQYSSSRGSEPTIAGHKRKLDALRPPISRETRPAPETAPSVPSFGLQVTHTPPGGIPKKQHVIKGPSNTLGLVPSSIDPSYSDSDASEEGEKFADEEAMHAELGDKLTFEHNGVVMNLRTASDVEAWKRERKRNWPTRTRMSEKEAEQRRTGDERRRLLEEATTLDYRPPSGTRVAANDREPLKDSAGDSDSDGAPVETSAKQLVASPVKRELPNRRPTRMTPRPIPSHKRGIHQRLLDQEQEGEDKLSLEVVKYLGRSGFFRPET